MLYKGSIFLNNKFWKTVSFSSPVTKEQFIILNKKRYINFPIGEEIKFKVKILTTEFIDAISYYFFYEVYLSNPNVYIYDQDYLMYKEKVVINRFQLLDFS